MYTILIDSFFFKKQKTKQKQPLTLLDLHLRYRKHFMDIMLG